MRALGLVLVLAGCNAILGVHDFGAPQDANDASREGAVDATAVAWWKTDWTRRSSITLDTTGVTEPLAKFPVLVRIGVGDVDVSEITATGADVRFIASDGVTLLPYEIDTYGASGASIWVGVDLPLASAPRPVIWMYYGNKTATAPTTTLWSDDVSVHHLTDFGDATGNGHLGLVSSSNPLAVAGAIGIARQFNGTTDALQLQGVGGFTFTTAMTVSLWMNVAGFTKGLECLVCKGDSTWRVHRAAATRQLSFATDSGGLAAEMFGTAVVDDGVWHHVAVTIGGGTKSLYVDGNLDHATSVLTLDTNNAAVVFGQNFESNSTRALAGMLDEVRISSIARSATWLRLEHATVANLTFATIGPIEHVP